MIDKDTIYSVFDIESQTLQKWQKTINLLSSLLNLPSALIMRLNKNKIEVFISSEDENSPYKKGDNDFFYNSGLYCEHVIKTQNMLNVKNALTDLRWKNNPDIKLNMISYLGLPINLAQGEPFGTICVLDNKERTYNEEQIALLTAFKNIIEEDLKNISLYKKIFKSEKIASLENLLAGVSHEINTPIGIALTSITHLKELTTNLKSKLNHEHMSEEDLQNYLDSSLELSDLLYCNLNKSVKIINSFKEISRDQLNEERKEFNINEYLEKVLISSNSIMKNTNINITITSSENITIKSYPGVFSQVITSLISNSIMHAYDDKQKGEIIINYKKVNNNIILNYKDDGKGIKNDNIDKIFDPFFTTNCKSINKGLGLNLIYNLINKQLHGTIKCTPNLKNGAEFIIEFPCE